MTEPARPRFDLTAEPWIPCERLDGSQVELGFEDVLVHAHELSCVHDESPLATAMIHRLLLAILHRVVDGPSSAAEWKKLWEQPRFDAARVKDYLGKWRHRFDLFDRDRPFLQVAGLRAILEKERGGKEAKPVPAQRLALERSPHAVVVSLLEHGGDEIGVSPAQALKSLLGFISFGPSGRILNDSLSWEACPLRPGAVVLARGRSLLQTLLLNLLVYANERPFPQQSDLPAWEDANSASKGSRAVRGWLDALTWQGRRVELVPEVDGVQTIVRRAWTGAGLEPSGEWYEPMRALLVRDKKRGPEPVRIEPERAAWRDCVALFHGPGGAGDYRRPAACSQIQEMMEYGALDRAIVFDLQLYGIATKRDAAIHLWRSEQVPLPVSLLCDAERLEVVQQALLACDEVHDVLRSSAWLLAQKALAPGNRDPDRKDVDALVRQLDVARRYWSELGARFPALLRSVGSDRDPEDALIDWKDHAKRTARRVLAGASAALGAQGRAMQAGALAEHKLNAKLKALWATSQPNEVHDA